MACDNRASTRPANSRTSRDFPTPGAPKTVTSEHVRAVDRALERALEHAGSVAGPPSARPAAAPPPGARLDRQQPEGHDRLPLSLELELHQLPRPSTASRTSA